MIRNITIKDCRDQVRSWQDWNHDTVTCHYVRAERTYVAKVEQVCDPFRRSALAVAKTKRAALAGLWAILQAGPLGRRPT